MKKTLFMFALLILNSTNVFANNGKIDYCNCYHANGAGDLANFIRNEAGRVESVNIYSTGRKALSYTIVKDSETLSAVISKYYRGTPNSAIIGSAEVIFILKNPTNGFERYFVVFRDKNGVLVSMTEDWGGSILNCEGITTGLKSFCAASDLSIVESAK